MARAEAVVVGGGIVGACCALALAEAGVRVTLVERAALAGGATAAGEGNILVSDKDEGPELELARLSLDRWRALATRADEDIELEAKGGVVVATSAEGLASLQRMAARQRAAGIDAREVDGDGARALEPELAGDVSGGVSYPEDHQVQPVLAAAAVLRLARRAGAEVRWGETVNGVDVDPRHGVRGVRTSAGTIAAERVVVAAGPHSGAVARLAGATVPVEPRRGHILVTAPTAMPIRHKVYDADYVGTISDRADVPQVSTVVETTRGGTVLIGSSREFVGFDRRLSLPVLARIAQRAARLFPRLATTPIIRAYVGFRPWTADHLPLIGPDPRTPGLFHATGHEGAGIGLAPMTGELLAALVTGGPAPLEPAPFDPGRASLRPDRHEGAA